MNITFKSFLIENQIKSWSHYAPSDRSDSFLNRPLVAYPNVAFDRSQQVELPAGTEVELLTDFAKQNLVKFSAEGQIWFTPDNDYFKATMRVSER